MSILLHCECGHRWRVADELARKRIRCPDCDARVAVPTKIKRSESSRSSGGIEVLNQSDQVIAFDGLRDLRKALLKGEITRHKQGRWTRPKPELSIPASCRNEAPLKEKFAKELARWKKQQDWLPIGEGLAEEEPIRMLYKPYSTYVTRFVDKWYEAAALPLIPIAVFIAVPLAMVIEGMLQISAKNLIQSIAFWRIFIPLVVVLGLVFFFCANELAKVFCALLATVLFLKQISSLPRPPADGY